VCVIVRARERLFVRARARVYGRNLRSLRLQRVHSHKLTHLSGQIVVVRLTTAISHPYPVEEFLRWRLLLLRHGGGRSHVLVVHGLQVPLLGV
jgi:hypothetical protein